MSSWLKLFGLSFLFYRTVMHFASGSFLDERYGSFVFSPRLIWMAGIDFSPVPLLVSSYPDVWLSGRFK